MKYRIDTKETVILGGNTQHIRIRSNDESNPVMLFIHGGPGICDRHWVLKYQSSLADIVTMVCWDQRGSGLSYSKNCKAEDLSVSRMVDDGAELAKYLAEKFNKKKIIIVGHSWGTILGSLLAKKNPELIEAYIGMGQFVDGAENERLSYKFVYDKAIELNDKKAKAELDKIGWPQNGHYRCFDDLMVQRNWMTKFGGGGYGEKESIWTSMIIPLIKTREYNLFDIIKYAKGAFFTLKALWDEVVDQNFFTQIPQLEMPVFLTEGRHDQNTPIPIAEKWFAALKAPYKEWIWFEKSAHSPIKEEPENWNMAVRAVVKKVGELSTQVCAEIPSNG